MLSPYMFKLTCLSVISYVLGHTEVCMKKKFNNSLSVNGFLPSMGAVSVIIHLTVTRNRFMISLLSAGGH